jgi:alkanesulfonate monooxygenase SsuD/methylene tetrahydromethanopterin reductase-like flavin-dependent oxidoreductase (luciferase family)
MPESLRFHLAAPSGWRRFHLHRSGTAHGRRSPAGIVRADRILPRGGAIWHRFVLVDFSSGKPDPMVLGQVLASAKERLKYMVAHRPGLMAPTLFVQQVNTFSTLAPGRITLNMVAGHSPGEQATYGDSLAHEERYARMQEYVHLPSALVRRRSGGF